MDIATVRSNLFGGLTAGVVALPLALAFGVQSGLGAEAGLYGAIILGLVAAALGGTETQISGPTGPITVLTAAIVIELTQTHGSLQQALPSLFFIFSLAGLFQLAFGVLRLGFYIRYIPMPVISGFMSGIGIIIILLQIYPSLGLAAQKNINDIVYYLPDALSNGNGHALLLAIGTIAVSYLSPYITKAIPGSLVALIVMTLLNIYLGWQVPLIGHIPAGLPEFQFQILDAFHLNTIYHAIWPALTIAVVGALDSLLTALIADKRTKTSHRSNKELIGQGIGNFLTGLFGGIPGAGATMRTVVNINSGGTHRSSGVVHSLFLLAILVGLGKYAAYIPLSVLAGILVTVGISIIDYRGIGELFVIPRADALILVMVILLTVFVGLLQAVVIGFVIASVSTIHRVGSWAKEKSNVVSVYKFAKKYKWKNHALMSKAFYKNIYLKNIEGPLFFGFTYHFQDLTRSIPNIQMVVIRMRRVPYIDQSGVYAIEEAYQYLTSKGIKVYITSMSAQVKQLLEQTQVIPSVIPMENVYHSFYELMQMLDEMSSDTVQMDASNSPIGHNQQEAQSLNNNKRGN